MEVCSRSSRSLEVAALGTEGAFFLVPLCVVSISNLSSWSKMTAEAPATLSSFQMVGKRVKHTLPL